MLYSEIMKRFGGNGDKLPMLDPVEDMEIEDSNLTTYISTRSKIMSELEKIETKS